MNFSKEAERVPLAIGIRQGIVGFGLAGCLAKALVTDRGEPNVAGTLKTTRASRADVSYAHAPQCRNQTLSNKKKKIRGSGSGPKASTTAQLRGY
jgi:hypothetical protein